MANQLKSIIADEYVIKKAVIFSERLKEKYDVKSYILELSLFEDIELPYISGSMTVMDDMGSFFEMNLKGTEQIELLISGAEESTSLAKFSITMNITSIVRKVKTNERTEVYTLSLVSPIAFKDEGIKVSKSYHGVLDSIAGNIVEAYLGVEVNRNYQTSRAVQEKVKVIIPYLSPLESATWLLDRATTIIGAPFYMWQSIWEQGEQDTVRIGTLDRMMTGGAVWNKDSPMIYSQAAAASVALLGQLEQDFIIKEFDTINNQDTTRLMSEGALGARLTNIDSYTGQNYSRHFDVKELLEDSKISLMRADQDGIRGIQNVFDESLTLNYQGQSKKSNKWDNRYFSTVTSYGTYGSINSYHDDPRELDAMNKMNSRATKALFNKNPINVVLNGAAFLKPLTTGASTGVSAGDTLFMNFMRSDTREAKPEIDEVISGVYLIQRARHFFSNTKYQVSATVSKIDSNLPKNPEVEEVNPDKDSKIISADMF